jgi:hypothetical protein
LQIISHQCTLFQLYTEIYRIKKPGKGLINGLNTRVWGTGARSGRYRSQGLQIDAVGAVDGIVLFKGFNILLKAGIQDPDHVVVEQFIFHISLYPQQGLEIIVSFALELPELVEAGNQVEQFRKSAGITIYGMM